MITINNPPTFTVLIDRFLVTAEAYKIPVILLFNKIDTYIKKELNTISSLKKYMRILVIKLMKYQLKRVKI